MIIIEKKKILYVTMGILLILFTYMLTGYNTTTSLKKEVKTLQTVAFPVDNKVIIIDAGHGKPDEGAQSSNRNNRSGK